MKKLLYLILFLPFLSTGQTVISNNLSVSAPKALDARTGKFVSGAWVPFATTSEANTAIPSSRRYVGLTVCIGTSTACTEYWYAGGIGDGNLTLKFVTSGSTDTTGFGLATRYYVGQQIGAYNPATKASKLGTVIVTPVGDSQLYSINTNWVVDSPQLIPRVSGALAHRGLVDSLISASGGGGGANNYPTTLSFNSGTRDLTLGRNGLSSIVANIPGGSTDTSSLSARIDYNYSSATAQFSRRPLFYNIVDSGAIGGGNTLYAAVNSTAIMKCYNGASSRGGGIIHIPYDHYMVDPMLLPSNQNLRRVDSIGFRSIEFRGDGPVSMLYGTVPTDTVVGLGKGGSIIQSFATTPGAYIFQQQANGSLHSGNLLIFRNLDIRTYPDPAIGGIDATWANQLHLIDCHVNTDQYSTEAGPWTSTSVYGVKTPGRYNGALTLVYNSAISGYPNGIDINEHHEHVYGSVTGCGNGLVFKINDHASHFNKVTIQACKYGLVGESGPHLTVIDACNFERPSSGPQTTIAHIQDPNNHINGDMKWSNVTSFAGQTPSIIQVGGLKLINSRFGTDPLAPVFVSHDVADTTSWFAAGRYYRLTGSRVLYQKITGTDPTPPIDTTEIVFSSYLGIDSIAALFLPDTGIHYTGSGAGSVVTRWQNVFGRDAYPPTGKEPEFYPANPGNYPNTLNFDGSTMLIVDTLAILANTNKISYYWVGSIGSSSTGTLMQLEDVLTNNKGWEFVKTATTDEIAVKHTGDAALAGIAETLTSGWHYIRAEHNKTASGGSEVSVWVDGVSAGTVYASGDNGNLFGTNLLFGIGGSPNSTLSNPSVSNAYILIKSGAFTPTDVSTLDAEMISKFGSFTTNF